MFYEIVIAPSYTPEGLEVLKVGLGGICEGWEGGAGGWPEGRARRRVWRARWMWVGRGGGGATFRDCGWRSLLEKQCLLARSRAGPDVGGARAQIMDGV
jgi:hypothetical protein